MRHCAGQRPSHPGRNLRSGDRAVAAGAADRMIPEPPWWIWSIIGGIISAYVVVTAIIWLGDHIEQLLP